MSNEAKETKITGTAESVKISIVIPNDLLNEDKEMVRSYAIVRNHEGQVDFLDCDYDDVNHTLTFKTDLFSDYAIVYRDVKKEEPTKPGQEETKPTVEPTKPGQEETKPTVEPTKPGQEETKPTAEPTKPGQEETKPTETPTKSEDTANPQTGDTANPLVWVFALTVAGFGIEEVIRRKRRADSK